MTFNLFSLTITISFKEFNVNFHSKKNNNHRAEKNILQEKTNLICNLVPKIESGNLNNISAHSISYSYTIDKNDFLNINIEINGITSKLDNYSIYQLGCKNDSEIKLRYNNVNYEQTSTEYGDNFTLFRFDLHNQNPKNLIITIRYKIKNMKQNANLYFVPRNYLRNVDMIKLSRNVKCYLACDDNTYENNIITFDGTNSPVLLSKKNKNYVSSIFFFEDYKRTYENK